MYKLHTLAFFIAILTAVNVQAQIYVSQFALGGNNDGTSWTDAYLDLAPALDAAIEDDEIWIALGEYFPPAVMIDDGDGIDTTHAFYLDKNLKIYGGFVGNETSVDQANPLFNPVILNGDMADDDIINRFDTLKDDNAHHIFYLTDNIMASTVLSGLFIWRGYANSDATGEGGGIYCEGMPTIQNCTVSECFAEDGGGIYLEGLETASVTIDNCDLDRNGAAGAGSAIYAGDLVNLSITNTKVSRNRMSEDGSIYLESIDNVNLFNCEIRDNGAQFSPAINALVVGDLSVDQCEIRNNHATGAFVMSIEDAGTAVFNRTKIYNNTADTFSAGLINVTGDLFLTNCLIAANQVAGQNMAGQLTAVSRVVLLHSTISGEHTPSISVQGSLETSNSIFHCTEVGAYQGLGPITSAGGNLCSDGSMNIGLILATDFTSVDPDLEDIAAGDYVPKPVSPCVGAAVPSSVVVDIEGNSRDANPDIGAYEYVVSATTQTEIPGLEIKLLPSITRDLLTVQAEGVEVLPMKYQLIDLSGRVYAEGKIDRLNQEIDATALAPGQYQMIFLSEAGKTSRSFIKL